MKNLTIVEKQIWASAFTNAVNIYCGCDKEAGPRFHSMWAMQDANYAVECYRFIKDDERIIK